MLLVKYLLEFSCGSTEGEGVPDQPGGGDHPSSFLGKTPKAGPKS